MSIHFDVCFGSEFFKFFFYGFEGVFDCGSCRGGKKEEVLLCQKCVWISYDLLVAHTIWTRAVVEGF